MLVRFRLKQGSSNSLTSFPLKIGVKSSTTFHRQVARHVLGGKDLRQDGLPTMYERSYGAHLEVLHGLTKKRTQSLFNFIQLYFVMAPVLVAPIFVAGSAYQEYSMKLQHFYSLLAQQATRPEDGGRRSLKRIEGPIFRKESENSIRKGWGSINHLYIMI